MSRQTILSALLALAAQTTAQQVGTNQAEVHPPLPYEKCTASGCTTVDTSVVIDANWRWVHNVTGYTNCYTGNTWNKALCPDPTTCAETCALDGAAYGSTYGISTSGNALTLDLVTGANIGSRNYLLNAAGTKYEMFMLKGMEFTFDVDVSNLPCGLNGALYFVAMDADGGLAKYPTNKAGAAYGTGYCDAQCPQDLKFIDGLANVVNWTPSTVDSNSGTGSAGSCCTEMDIWEANSISQALTPHDCSVTGQTACNSTTTCGTGAANRYTGLCDKDGCDFNPYRWGNHTFYGPGETVNTNSKFTVVTQFITNDGTTTGTLTAIKRLYVQNGKVINQSNTDVAGITTTNEITDTFCNQQKNVTGDTNEFEKLGGLATMGKAMANGMVLVLSIWDDYAANMLWLDSDYPTASPATAPGVARGTCSTTSGNPATVNSQSPNSHVIYSNIKLGTIGSTYAH